MDRSGRAFRGAEAAALGAALLLGVLAPASVTPSAAEFSTVELSGMESSSTEPAPLGWQLPVAAEELRPFARPPSPWGAGHRGVDLGPLSVGATIRAPTEGEISFAGVVVDRPVLSIRHGNGYLSSFEPVETTREVGDRVSRGDPVGRLTAGVDHCEVPCLHWGVRLYGEYINPLLLTGDLEPSVLLPLEEGRR